MTRPFEDETADDLRTAFRDAIDTAVLDGVDVDRVWRAVSGESPPEERRLVVERVAADPSWALAWRAAHELWTASGEGGAIARVSVRAPRRPRILALAAVLLVATGVGLFLRDRPVPEYRGPRAAITSRLPADRVFSRKACVLQWAGPAGATYDVRVLSEDMRLVHATAGLTASEYQVPEDFLSAFPAGARLLWQVRIQQADGSEVAGPTFVARLE